MAALAEEDGGAELDDVCVKILETELTERNAPIPCSASPRLVWPAVEAHGDPGLRDELKPAIAKGTAKICIGYTEPDGGSDIAGAKTRAARDGDEWVINGQKIFTSMAQVATHVFLLTRTDPTLAKHKGLTLFLVPLSTPGFERQPLPTIGDETVNITYYSDIRVSDRYRIGGVNDGWSTLHGPLDAEHYLDGPASKLEEVGPGEVSCAIWTGGRSRGALGQGRPGRGRPDDQRRGVPGRNRPSGGRNGGQWLHPLGDGQGNWLRHRPAGLRAAHRPGRPGRDAPLGAEGAIGDGIIEFGHRQAQLAATPGGTVEVFRTIIAQADLGLPRPDYPGRRAFLPGDRPAPAAA